MWFVAVILALVVIAAVVAVVGTRRRPTQAGTSSAAAPPGGPAREPTHADDRAGAVHDDDLRRHAEAVGLRGVDDADSREIVERLKTEQPSRRQAAEHTGGDPAGTGDQR